MAAEAADSVRPAAVVSAEFDIVCSAALIEYLMLMAQKIILVMLAVALCDAHISVIGVYFRSIHESHYLIYWRWRRWPLMHRPHH